MAGETLRFDITGDSASASRAFRSAADSAALAARGAKQCADMLGIQSKSAQVSAAATLALAKSDKILRDAELELSGAADEAGRQLQQQGRAAEEAAVKTRLAGEAAKGAGGGFGVLATPMGGAVAAGVALAPVLVTVGAGLAGLAAAAYSTVKPILAAGTATKQARAELAGLDPAQRAAYQSLTALKSQYAGFAKALEPEVIGLFNQGLSIASGLFRDIAPVASATGKALGGVLGQIDAEFRGGTWQQFFGFMAREAGPDVQLLGAVFTDLLHDLPPLLTALQPVAVELLQGADNTAILLGKLAQLANVAENATGSMQTSADGTQHWAQSQNVLGQAVHNAWTEVVGHLIPGADKLIPKAQQLTKELIGSGSAAKNAAAGISATATATADAGVLAKVAAPPTQQLSANLYVEGANAKTAADEVTKLNSAWSAFLSMSTDLVTAQIGVEGGLKTLATDAKQTGASFTGVNDASQKLQTDFETNLVPGVQNVINGMRKAQASSHDLAVVVATDLKPAVDRGALSNAALRQQIYDMAVEAGYAGPNQVKALRDWLDRNAGSAQNAANKVNVLAGSLARLPKKVTTIVDVGVEGSGGIKITASSPAVAASIAGAINKQLRLAGAYATGGMVPGTGSGDTVPALLTPGEAVVPKKLVPAVAPLLKAHGVPGFAAGGIAGGISAMESSMSGTGGSWAATTGRNWAAQVTAAYAQAVAANAKAAAARAVAGAGLSSVASIRAEQQYALSLFPHFGWGAGQLPPLIALWNRESGWNANARNPSSGAYGIPQALPPSKMGFLGNTWAGQILWGENYILGRYGNPANAWAHEVAYNWYDNGGLLKPGLTLALNTTGRAEQVIPAAAGAGGGNVTIVLENRGVIGSKAELENWLARGIDSLARQGKLAYALRRSPSA